MEPQQLVTTILVLVLSVIAWMAGFFTGIDRGIGHSVNSLAKGLEEQGFDMFQIREILSDLQKSKRGREQKTPTDEQQG